MSWRYTVVSTISRYGAIDRVDVDVLATTHASASKPDAGSHGSIDVRCVCLSLRCSADVSEIDATVESTAQLSLVFGSLGSVQPLEPRGAHTLCASSRPQDTAVQRCVGAWRGWHEPTGVATTAIANVATMFGVPHKRVFCVCVVHSDGKNVAVSGNTAKHAIDNGVDAVWPWQAFAVFALVIGSTITSRTLYQYSRGNAHHFIVC
jgi:hypothetical protein